MSRQLTDIFILSLGLYRYFSRIHLPIIPKMRETKQNASSLQNEKILCLLAELNSTLDLYYDKIIDLDISSPEK